MKKNILCVIPARGGSKRIPNKNILLLGGKPLIVHSIEHAKKSKLIKKIIVSTDSPEITRVSKKCGVEVVRRPKRISGDHAAPESAIKHVIEQVEKSGFYPDLIVFLQCTSPIRGPHDIDRAIKKLYKENADSLLSVCRNERFLWRSVFGNMQPVNYDYLKRPRDQDHPEEYRENGSIYIFKPEVMQKYGNRLGGKIAVYEMDYWSSFQIDSPEHFELCEWIYEKREKSFEALTHPGEQKLDVNKTKEKS